MEDGSHFHKRNTALEVLPRDIWNEILGSNLALPDLLSLSETTPALNSICNQHVTWKDYSLKRWPKANIPEKTHNNPLLWKNWYATQNKIERNIRSANVELYETKLDDGCNWIKIVDSPYDDLSYYYVASQTFAFKLLGYQLPSSVSDSPSQSKSICSFQYETPAPFVDVDFEKVVIAGCSDASIPSVTPQHTSTRECVLLRNNPLLDGTPLDIENASRFPLTNGNLEAISVKQHQLATSFGSPENYVSLWDLNTGQLSFNQTVSDTNTLKCENLAWQTDSTDNQNVVSLWGSSSKEYTLYVTDPRQPHPCIKLALGSKPPRVLMRNNILGVMADNAVGRRSYNNSVKLYDLRKLTMEQFGEIESVGSKFHAFTFDENLTRLLIVHNEMSLEFLSLHDCKTQHTIPSWAWQSPSFSQDVPAINQIHSTSKYVAMLTKGDSKVISLANSTNVAWKKFPYYQNKPLPKQRGVSSAEMFYKIVESRVNSGSLQGDLNTLLQASGFSDLQIITSEQKFDVHRCILAIRSPVLRTILKEMKTRPATLEWLDTPACVVQKLLQWIYTGQCELGGSVEELCLLLKLAHTFELKLLVRSLMDFFTQTESCLPPLSLVIKQDLEPLLDHYIKLFRKNPTQLHLVSAEDLQAVLKRMSQLEVLPEEQVKSSFDVEGATASVDIMELDFPNTSEFPVKSQPFKRPEPILQPTSTEAPEDQVVVSKDQYQTTAFLLFELEKRAEVKNAYPAEDSAFISNILQEMWKKLPHNLRKSYLLRARDNRRHMRK